MNILKLSNLFVLGLLYSYGSSAGHLYCGKNRDVPTTSPSASIPTTSPSASIPPTSPPASIPPTSPAPIPSTSPAPIPPTSPAPIPPSSPAPLPQPTNNCGDFYTEFSSNEDLGNFNVEYCPQNVRVNNGLEMMVSQSCGITISYKKKFTRGKIETFMKMAPNSGVVSAFILTGNEPSDEIDIEWVGKDVFTFQSMYFVKGQRIVYDPGFHPSPNQSTANLSENFHKYGIEVTDTFVKWYIDDILVRTLEKTSDATFPSETNTIKFGVWDGSSVGIWAGYVDWSVPVLPAYMKWIRITNYC
ncbi:hypothetical protein BB559_007590 [Furculomyces boomerangus]|uniref:GH16 domain-containing protein n=1 Tax=Furculomyces boomerangus TaxID=61424 RepID=A0A2T9XWS4_9FUNG|nr:hypothetical protein BB559_007590 [Furculomyces boomerangus]